MRVEPVKSDLMWFKHVFFFVVSSQVFSLDGEVYPMMDVGELLHEIVEDKTFRQQFSSQLYTANTLVNLLRPQFNQVQ